MDEYNEKVFRLAVDAAKAMKLAMYEFNGPLSNADLLLRDDIYRAINQLPPSVRIAATQELENENASRI